MVLYHVQVHKVKFLMPKYLMCDCEPYFKSSPEPYIQEFHKKYFSANYDLIEHTNQNHKF